MPAPVIATVIRPLAALAPSPSKVVSSIVKGKAKQAIGSLNINVETNISSLSKALDAFGKDQIPFATANALTSTAFVVREHIVERTYPQAFTERNKRFAGTAFRVEKANKRKLEARVFDRFGKDFLALQATGGVKRPRGSTISIPTDEINRTGRGVAKARRPRALLAGGKRAFRQKTKSGQDVIMQRRGKARYPLKVLYIQEPSANIDKRFNFYEDAGRTVQKVFDDKFRISFARAKKTAFRKKGR